MSGLSYIISSRGLSVSEKEGSQSLSPPEPNSKTVLQREDVEDLRKALEEERKKTEEYMNKLKYLQADFENSKRRVLNEIRAVSDSGVRELVRELLTVIDELDCALDVGKKMHENKAMVEGVGLVRQKLLSILQKDGLVKIEAVGQKLDPNKHEAILRGSADPSQEGTILEEIRTGYIFKGQVIRPSLVKVAISDKK